MGSAWPWKYLVYWPRLSIQKIAPSEPMTADLGASVPRSQTVSATVRRLASDELPTNGPDPPSPASLLCVSAQIWLRPCAPAADVRNLWMRSPSNLPRPPEFSDSTTACILNGLSS